jgi:NAD(P)-dependent dehydrogenase (short-subunit alcohol dehydrogenase family)
MQLRNRVAVVTGGAGGIGRALARRLVDEQVRGVVVADIDEARARTTAAELGARALAVGCDVADDAQVGELIARAEAAFGPIDLFCANAGVMHYSGIDTADEAWDVAFDVNVRAHVIAARRLIPRWVARGEGYLLSTASAAGLLTQIGALPYSVTKHAAVAFAEWVSITYGDRGVRVSCLCPMGVETAMLDAGRGGEDALGASVVTSTGAVLTPAQVADEVVAAVREERFLVLPHPEVLEFFRRKAADYDRWLAGMRRLQSRSSATSAASRAR